MPISVQFNAPSSGLIPDEGRILLATPLLLGSGEEVLVHGHWEMVDQSAGHFVASNGPWRFAAFSAETKGPLSDLSSDVFDRLFSAMEGASLVRIWNFVPAINEVVDGLENYQAFCLGRHNSFVRAFGDQARETYCAASAVGVDDQRLTVFALACEEPVIQIENPLQVPAYEYPERYGPRPPSFSRASIASGATPAIFVSGTAAVRGSDSVGGDNLAEQLSVTGDNLSLIIAKCQADFGRGLSELGAPSCRVYVRNSADAPEIDAWLQQQPWYSPERCNLIRSDICRQELQVEIELSWPQAIAR